MRRRRLTTLLTILVAGVAACGDENEASTPAGAVRAYNDAVADGDGERACGHLDPAAQEELRQSTQGEARRSCERAIELVAAFYDDATKERLRKAEVAATTRGDEAAARLTTPTGFGERRQRLELRRVDGEWKIVSLGLTVEPPPPAP